MGFLDESNVDPSELARLWRCRWEAGSSAHLRRSHTVMKPLSFQYRSKPLDWQWVIDLRVDLWIDLGGRAQQWRFVDQHSAGAGRGRPDAETPVEVAAVKGQQQRVPVPRRTCGGRGDRGAALSPPPPALNRAHAASAAVKGCKRAMASLRFIRSALPDGAVAHTSACWRRSASGLCRRTKERGHQSAPGVCCGLTVSPRGAAARSTQQRPGRPASARKPWALGPVPRWPEKRRCHRTNRRHCLSL